MGKINGLIAITDKEMNNTEKWEEARVTINLWGEQPDDLQLLFSNSVESINFDVAYQYVSKEEILEYVDNVDFDNIVEFNFDLCNFKNIMKSQLLDIEDELEKTEENDMYCDKLIKETEKLLQNVNTMSGSAEKIVYSLLSDIRNSLADLIPPIELDSNGIELMQMEINDKINFINALYQDVITKYIDWNTKIKVIYKNGGYHYDK